MTLFPDSTTGLSAAPAAIEGGVPPEQPFQFTLRQLLMLMAVCGVAFGAGP
jgi:hypothetical protein